MVLFNSLMNSGGYTNVVHHYHDYPGRYSSYNANKYSGWSRTKKQVTINNYTTNKTVVNKSNYSRPEQTYKSPSYISKSTYKSSRSSSRR